MTWWGREAEYPSWAKNILEVWEPVVTDYESERVKYSSIPHVSEGSDVWFTWWCFDCGLKQAP